MSPRLLLEVDAGDEAGVRAHRPDVNVIEITAALGTFWQGNWNSLDRCRWLNVFAILEHGCLLA